MMLKKIKSLWKNKPKLFIGMAIYGYLLKKWGQIVFDGIAGYLSFLTRIPLGEEIQIYVASIIFGTATILIGNEVTEIIAKVVRTVTQQIKKRF